MTFTMDEKEFYEKYKFNKVRGYVDYDGRYVDDFQSKEEIDRTYIVYNQTLTPAKGGEKSIYRECETESEAQAIVKVLNSIFTTSVTVDFSDVEDGEEETMTYDHVIVQWVYA